MAFLLKGLLLPAIGFGDLWFNTDVARGVDGGGWNVYRGVEKQLADRYRELPPDYVAPYGPAYYVPLWSYHRMQEAVGLAQPQECDAACELRKRPLFWGFNAKLPHLFLDAACILLLMMLLPRRTGRRAALLWATSPGLLYVFYVMGQNDVFPLITIIAGFCVLASSGTSSRSPDEASWWTRHSDTIAMVLLGIGGATKVIPLFFAIAFALVIRRNIWRALGLIGVSVLTMLVLALPFVGTDYFVHAYLLSGRAVYVLTPEAIGFNLFSLAAVATVVVARSSRDAGRVQRLLVALLGMSAAIALFQDFNPQRGVYLAGAVAVAAAYVPLPTSLLLAANGVVLIHPFISSALGAKTLVFLSPFFGDLRAPVEAFTGYDYTAAARLATRSAALVGIVYAIVVVLRRHDERTRQAGRFLRQPAALLGGCLVLVGILVAPLALGRWGPDSKPDISPTGDVAGTVVRQAFTPPHDDLERIDVYIDPFGRTVPRFVELQVLDGCNADSAVLRQARGDLFALFNGRAAYVPFEFRALPDIKGRRLCFELDFRPFDDGRAVGLVLAAKAEAEPAMLRDTPASAPMAFRDRYAVEVGSVLSSVTRRIGREWPIALASPVLALIVGLGVVLLTGGRSRGQPEEEDATATEREG